MDFTKIFQLKGLKPKNKVHMNFYECCGLTEKVYLMKTDTYFIKEEEEGGGSIFNIVSHIFAQEIHNIVFN